MAHNRELATAMELVRRTNAEIAFVAGVTDIGLDDDLLRLRSRQVVLEGYSHNKQPKQRPWCHPSWGSIYKRGRKSYTKHMALKEYNYAIGPCSYLIIK